MKLIFPASMSAQERYALGAEHGFRDRDAKRGCIPGNCIPGSIDPDYRAGYLYAYNR